MATSRLSLSMSTLQRFFPNVTKELQCPACMAEDIHDQSAVNYVNPTAMRSVSRTIMHLNDWHRWTREAIADWLDTLDIDLTVKREEVTNYGTGTEDETHNVIGGSFSFEYGPGYQLWFASIIGGLGGPVRSIGHAAGSD